MALTFAALLAGACEVDYGTRKAMAGQTVIIGLGDGRNRTFLVPPNHKYIVRKFTSDVWIEDYTPPTSEVGQRRIYTVEGNFVRSIEIH